jgi:hypothetical protein
MTRPPRRRRAGLAVLLAALALPAAALAQEEGGTFPDLDLDALKDRLDRAWESLSDEVEPAIESLARALETMERIDDLEHYGEPRVLENGDILIPRNEDAPPLPPAPETSEEEGIRL